MLSFFKKKRLIPRAGSGRYIYHFRINKWFVARIFANNVREAYHKFTDRYFAKMTATILEAQSNNEFLITYSNDPALYNRVVSFEYAGFLYISINYIQLA